MKNKADNNLLLGLIRDRRSVRAFLDTPIPRSTIKSIVEAARWAPSGVNTQPWNVISVGEKSRYEISKQILLAIENQQPKNPDYQYYPDEWFEPYKQRRKDCGMALYGALNIQKEDVVKCKEQWLKNYYFFHAPAALIFYIDKNLCQGSWLDFGMFLQNIMLASRTFNLETCPQAALAEYPDIIRSVLGINEQFHIVCGMALGYEDKSNPVNQYRTQREPIESFFRWTE